MREAALTAEHAETAEMRARRTSAGFVSFVDLRALRGSADC